MKVLLADGQELGFQNNYEMVKFLLFGAEKMGIPIINKPKIVATPEILPLLKAKREIQAMRIHVQITKELGDKGLPF